MRQINVMAALALLNLVLPRIEAGSIYDAAADFSLNGNPNGVWTYGYSTTLTGSLILNDHSGEIPFPHTPQLVTWYTPLSSLGPPFVGINPTSTTMVFNNGSQIIIQPQQMVFHPGPNGEFEKVRFTAPAPGQLVLNVAFGGADTRPTTTDVHVLENGVELFAGAVNSFGDGPSYTQVLSLKTGDTIDFAVGYGSNRNFGFDSTTLSATLSTAVPEPSTMTLALVGGLVIVCCARRLRTR